MDVKKTISYILPHIISKGKTALGQNYEIAYEYGYKVLNSENANYSFGSLHQVMQKGITAILKHIKPTKILLLGLGGGSALRIFEKKFSHSYQITAIEIDNDIITIALNHFNLNKYKNLETINADASLWIENASENSFDLIIDDIFMDSIIPDFCFKKEYLENCSKLLIPNGIYFRNTMNLETSISEKYYNILSSVFKNIELLRVKNLDNSIYLCKNQV